MWPFGKNLPSYFGLHNWHDKSSPSDKEQHTCAGMVIGPCIPYIIGLVLAFCGLLITMFTDEAYKEFGLDKTFYRWAQIFLHYHCGLCSARWWPCLRRECHFSIKLVGFLGPSIFLGFLLSPWIIGPAYTVSCGNEGQKISKAILLAFNSKKRSRIFT